MKIKGAIKNLKYKKYSSGNKNSSYILKKMEKYLKST